MKREIYRPLRIVHGDFGYAPEDTLEKKCRCIRERIAELKAKGYGGIVTNVSFVNYMQDADEWQLMKEKVHACREQGMRMWLYDEDGYPSGIAGTQTIAQNADFEARAAVMVSHVLAPGEELELPLPRGHEKLLAAVCYRMAGDAPTDDELLHPHARPVGLPVHFVNDTQTPLLCLAFFEKHMYEGAHAQHNVYSSRRYIDVSNRDAVAAFIDNTYRRYTALLGDSYARRIGDEAENAVIEAIFTDEPSYMGCYINAELYPDRVDHPYDNDIPLYPVVNWGRDVANRFASVNGYRLEDELTALFLGHSEHFCQVRQAYHQLMSDLYEQAFFAQLSDYCATVGLSFSGHILLEDELHLHVLFEGNFFNLLRHMHIPGMDMLQSTPQTVWDFAFTPRLVRSIAELYGREHVMDEVSDHNQQAHHYQISADERYIALMLQLAFGVDVFTSYYNDSDPTGDMRRTLDALNRATEALAGQRLSDTLLLYPIETMMRNRRPQQPLCEADSDSDAKMTVCEAAMLEAQFAMLNRQKSFTYTDAATAQAQAVRGRHWRSFVITACDVTPALAEAAAALAAKGTQIIWYCPVQAQGLFGAGLDRLPAGTVTVQTAEQLLAAVRPEGPQLTVQTPGESTDGIACAQTAACTLLVNRDAADRRLCWHGAPVEAVDAATGTAVPVQTLPEGTGFVLPARAALLLRTAL